MNFSEMFPSNFLTQDDFPQPRVLVMAGVAMEELRRPGGKTQTKPVLHFKTGKPMVLNKTNGQVIAKKYSRDSLKWTDQPIEVYFDPTVKMGKDEVGGLRVRIPASTSTTTPHQYTSDEVHNKLLKEYGLAPTQEHMDQWAGWATKRGFKFTPEQQLLQAAAYQQALERLGLVKPQSVVPADADETDDADDDDLGDLDGSEVDEFDKLHKDIPF